MRAGFIPFAGVCAPVFTESIGALGGAVVPCGSVEAFPVTGAINRYPRRGIVLIRLDPFSPERASERSPGSTRVFSQFDLVLSGVCASLPITKDEPGAVESVVQADRAAQP